MNRRRHGKREKSREKASDSAEVWIIRGLTRGRAAEPVSRGQILRRERGQGKILFSLFSRPQAELATMPG